MKRLLLLTALVALLTGGCTSMTRLAKQLKDDPAIVTVRMGTPWGNQLLNRIGGTTNSVDVLPDGTVRINPRPDEVVVVEPRTAERTPRAQR